MSASDKATFQSATSKLSKRLDPGGRVLSVQDFRRSIQRDSGSVADFLRKVRKELPACLWSGRTQARYS